MYALCQSCSSIISWSYKLSCGYWGGSTWSTPPMQPKAFNGSYTSTDVAYNCIMYRHSLHVKHGDMSGCEEFTVDDEHSLGPANAHHTYYALNMIHIPRSHAFHYQFVWREGYIRYAILRSCSKACAWYWKSYAILLIVFHLTFERISV